MIPIAPTRDRNSTGHTERTDGRLCAAPGGSGIHAFAFLPIRYSFLYRTCLQPPSPKTVLKVFHLYRYKKSEKLSPENQIFQKKFESCRNSSQKRKKQVILLYRTAEDQTSNRDWKWNNRATDSRRAKEHTPPPHSTAPQCENTGSYVPFPSVSEHK